MKNLSRKKSKKIRRQTLRAAGIISVQRSKVKTPAAEKIDFYWPKGMGDLVIKKFELCANPEFPDQPEQLWEKRTYERGRVEWSIYTGGVIYGRSGNLDAGIIIKSQ